MGIPRFDSPDEEIKKWLNHIALICLSEDFQALKRELEKIYHQSQMEDAQLMAFKDALYAFLAQKEDEMLPLTGIN
ncbi:MAG: hypothetical protein FWC60_01530 [Firmicutes bacterium]|nr:hypothetical protein [Bacillota bacterium]